LKGWPHFEEPDFKSALGGLQRGFASCQPTTNYGQVSHESDSTIVKWEQFKVV
jgi:hypothetical protein